jgi:hypothetical protein
VERERLWVVVGTTLLLARSPQLKLSKLVGQTIEDMVVLKTTNAKLSGFITKFGHACLCYVESGQLHLRVSESYSSMLGETNRIGGGKILKITGNMVITDKGTIQFTGQTSDDWVVSGYNLFLD